MVQLFTSGFCVYTYLMSLVSCSEFLSRYYLTALFIPSHSTFIPLFLLHSCKCPCLLSQKTTSTTLAVHIRFNMKAELYLTLLTLKILFPFRKTWLQKIPTVNSLQFPNFQFPILTQPAGTSSSDRFRHWPNTVHTTLDKRSQFLLLITNPNLVLPASFYGFAPL